MTAMRQSMGFLSQESTIEPDTNDNDGVDIGRRHKIGHLRIDEQGNATFKRLPTNHLIQALQLGIQHTVGGIESRPPIDVLYQDFGTIETISFPKEGRDTSPHTPAHRFNDFAFRSYAPVAFRHFRGKFNIEPADFLISISRPFRELKNPGASGSLFYLTADDQFILKTVQKREASFLKSLLPGYYMNLMQNPRTLLPKFFGLYCYQASEILARNKPGLIGENKNIRITVMNNLIPSHLQMHEKYDLKGSTYKRQASSEERKKESPTWKDLDFIERHPNGLLLDPQTYQALKNTVERDCRVLESFHIMDYSFLLCIHQIDASSENTTANRTIANSVSIDAMSGQPRRLLYSTPMDNIQGEFDIPDRPNQFLAQNGGIPARNDKGQQLSLFVGIIDILQSYQLKKKLEHAFKSMITDGSQVSVTHPKIYSARFQSFLFRKVFKEAPHSGDLRRQQSNPMRVSRSRDRIREFTGASSYTGTVNSRISSYYSSLRSTVDSDRMSPFNSSQTIYCSSRQSDSLYNGSSRRITGRILVTRDPSDQRDDTSYTEEITRL